MKKASDDYVTHAGIVKRECGRFKLNELTVDNFRFLIFVQRLTAKRASEIRSRILSKMEANSKLTL